MVKKRVILDKKAIALQEIGYWGVGLAILAIAALAIWMVYSGSLSNVVTNIKHLIGIR